MAALKASIWSEVIKRFGTVDVAARGMAFVLAIGAWELLSGVVFGERVLLRWRLASGRRGGFIGVESA